MRVPPNSVQTFTTSTLISLAAAAPQYQDGETTSDQLFFQDGCVCFLRLHSFCVNSDLLLLRQTLLFLLPLHTAPTALTLLTSLSLVSQRQRAEPPEPLLLHAELPGQQGARWLPVHQPLLPVAAGPAAAQPALPLWHPRTEVGDALGQGLPHSPHAAAGRGVQM